MSTNLAYDLYYEKLAPNPSLEIKGQTNLSYSFWSVLILLLFLPMCKSGLINLGKLGQNIQNNFQLIQIKNQLKKDKQELQTKLRDYHSQNGMKRILKEEIKALEKKEFLIRITL